MKSAAAFLAFLLFLTSCEPAFAGEVCFPSEQVNRLAVRIKVCDEEEQELSLAKDELAKIKGGDTTCLPTADLQKSVKDLEVCKERDAEYGLARGEAETLKAANDSLARDYQAEIDKVKKIQEDRTQDDFKKFLWFFGGVAAGFLAGIIAK